MTINRGSLLQRENEYLMKKIKEELDTWRKNNYESAKHTVISIVISSLALVFGIFLFITEQINFGEEIKNIISTSVIGTGGSLTLFGSLSSLKNLFKEVNENAEEFKNTMDIFRDLYQKTELQQKTEPQQESNVKELVDQLEKYFKVQKKIVEFLGGLNKHMQHMLICRSIAITIASLVVLMLAIVSILYLTINSENDIFESIDILLICFSAIILYNSICVMICIQLIIPHITEHMFEEEQDEQLKFGKYKSKVPLNKLIEVLYKNIKEVKGCFGRLFKLLELGIFILFIFCFFILGLVSGDWEFKRIKIGDTEIEGINRILYGLPLKEYEIAVKQMDQTNI